MRFDAISDSRLRAAIRSFFGIGNQCVPINFGDTIGVTGEVGGWFTRGGRPIHSPSGYARCGWSNMVYQTNTQKITITPNWLRNFIRTSRPYTT